MAIMFCKMCVNVNMYILFICRSFFYKLRTKCGSIFLWPTLNRLTHIVSNYITLSIENIVKYVHTFYVYNKLK